MHLIPSNRGWTSCLSIYTIEGQLCKIADSCPLLCRSLVELIEISYYGSSATAEAKLARKTNELNKDM